MSAGAPPESPAERSPSPAPAAAPDRVLSTLNRDGSRRWLHPRLSPGRFLRRRRVVGYALIVVYNVLPWIRINGKPSILLDLPHREFTFFGTTFLPTDTLLLMLFLAGVFVAVFLVTALFGRLWCGWACPQTVYMELIYRPIERFFDGPPDARGRGKSRATGLRRTLKYLVFFIVSFHLAHTFLAYFVGPDHVLAWSRQSPFEHPTAFLVVLATTGLMVFDFCFFREQTCIVACPYGRFQSAMLDRHSLIISYDEKRGEPRGRLRRPAPVSASASASASVPASVSASVSASASSSATAPGDCVDCGLCVVTCPTGIDIREGLQMECIGCAQCIDACDAVMTKVGRATGLIRYSSQAAMEQTRRRLVRPRVVLYPLLLLGFAVTFSLVLANRQPADITLLRGAGRPYTTLDTGEIRDDVRIKIVNRTGETRRFRFSVEGIEGATIVCPDAPVPVAGGASVTTTASIVVPASSFDLGRARVTVRVEDDAGFAHAMHYRLQGPWGDASATGGSAASTERGE